MAMERENRAPRGRKRRKVCAFCVDKVECIDYKDAAKLRRYTSERGKILPRRTTGTCAMHQRQLTEAIKRARQVACCPTSLTDPTQQVPIRGVPQGLPGFFAPGPEAWDLLWIFPPFCGKMGKTVCRSAFQCRYSVRRRRTDQNEVWI